MSIVLASTLLTAALAASFACLLAGKRADRVIAGTRDTVRLPLLLRVLWRLGTTLERPLNRRLGTGVERRLRGLLARAGLDGELAPARWLAMLVAAVGAGALLLLIAASVGWSAGAGSLLLLAAVPFALHAWLRERASRRSVALLKELPTLLELLVLSLEAGASLGVALRIAADKSAPGPVRDLLNQILQRMRAGQSRSSALGNTLGALDLDATTALTTALVQAESSGMSLGPVLRAQAEQVMTERFVRAERAAMRAPVKLLLPLLGCIFPCTFIVIAIPIAARLVGLAAP